MKTNRTLAALAALFLLVTGSGCSSLAKATQLAPGRVHCSTTNSEFLTSRRCFRGTPSGKNELVVSETCVKADGVVTGCSSNYR